MNPFAFWNRFTYVGFALLVALASPAASQDRPGTASHCLSIADINERIDCLENSAAPNSDAASASSENPTRQQQSQTTSFDCQVARTSIERAICGDVTLSEWDARMGQLFQQALGLAKDRRSLLESQRLWLVQRDRRCSALADNTIWSCLLDITKARSAALAKVGIVDVETVSPAQIFPGITAPSATPQSHSNTPINTTNRASASPISENSHPADRTSGGDDNHTFAILFVALAMAFIITIAVRSYSHRKMLIAAENQRLADENRRLAEIQRLVAKYGDHAAARILAHEVWQGMTGEELVESRGNPADVGREIIRYKTRETWKYYQTGRNRFRERIYLENGVVIGWKI